MPAIFAYNKVITVTSTFILNLPTDEEGNPIGTELCTIDGVTYVSLPDGAELPEQPKEITVEQVTLSDELRAKIKAESPYVALINKKVAAKIAERYSISDEIKLLRTAPSAEFDEYNAFVEECRAWGKAEKAKLGL